MASSMQILPTIIQQMIAAPCTCGGPALVDFGIFWSFGKLSPLWCGADACHVERSKFFTASVPGSTPDPCRNALMEVSTVNLQRGQFWIFNRVGFYGKGAGPGHIKSRSAWEHHIIFLIVQAFLGM